MDFKIPNDLLDGDFIVFVNGIERDGAISKHEGYTSFSPWPGNDDHTVIEIIGTSAVPEFGLISVMILLVSVFSVIIFSKFSKLNLKI